MKLIKQTILHYREGASDKVYEIDLCEVGPGRYAVNFRYGRRGAVLKDGTKTVSPVAFAAAEKIFADLEASKRAKGYQDASAPRIPPPVPVKPSRDAGTREATILDRLVAAKRPDPSLVGRVVNWATGKKDSSWPLERVIWRAGELKLRAAAKPLIDLIGSGSATREYCIAWALGWCGDETTISALGNMWGDRANPDFIRRMAGEALLKLSDTATRAAFRADMREQLPPELRTAYAFGPDRFGEAFRAYLATTDVTRFQVLNLLYAIEDEVIRPALLDFARTAPLRPPHFKFLRAWFKSAEYRRDAEMFGILAYRFETEKAMFRHPQWGNQIGIVNEDGKYVAIDISRELRLSNPKFAYGSRTRAYLRRRVWRTLRRLAELRDPDYVKMAVGVLLPFTDADAKPPYEREYYSWRTNVTRHTRWDAFAGFYAFGHILYGNSPRYEIKPGSLAWRCRPAYRPGGPPPPVREESFPTLWDDMPVGLLHLLSESACLPVHEFAVKALRANPAFCATLDLSAIVMLLDRPYDATARLGLDLARETYRPSSPNLELVAALALCRLAEARAQAVEWLSTAREIIPAEPDFVARLLLCAHADTRAGIRTVLRATAFSDDAVQRLVRRAIAGIVALADGEIIRDAADTLLTTFPKQLRRIGFDLVRDLLAHPAVEAQEFGANVLLAHEIAAVDFPPGILDALLESDHEPIRAIGVRLLGTFPDDRLRGNPDFVLTLAGSARRDVREAFRPLLRRLLAGDADFARDVARRIHAALLGPEAAEGVHAFLVDVVRADAPGAAAFTNDEIRALLEAASAPARDLGGFVMIENADRFADAPTAWVAALGRSEIASVREAVRAVFRAKRDRFRADIADLAAALRILDSPWEDVRAFGFEFFRAEFTADHFTPELLVAVVDSVKPDVQRFGQDLIARHFRDGENIDYLVKLSEHPSAAVQLFATNFLDPNGDADRLRRLEPYFVSVLSRVNQARTAKERVIAFLKAEAMKDAVSAEIVAEIFARQAATIAVRDKAHAIEALVAIRKNFPAVPSPVEIKPVASRS